MKAHESDTLILAMMEGRITKEDSEHLRNWVKKSRRRFEHLREICLTWWMIKDAYGTTSARAKAFKKRWKKNRREMQKLIDFFGELNKQEPTSYLRSKYREVIL